MKVILFPTKQLISIIVRTKVLKNITIRDAVIIHILLLKLNATILLGIFHRLPDMLVPMHYLW